MPPTDSSYPPSSLQLSAYWSRAIASQGNSAESAWNWASEDRAVGFRKHDQPAILTRSLEIPENWKIIIFLGIQHTDTPTEMDLWVRISPQDDMVYLPSNLQLMVLDRTQDVVMQASTRETQQLQLEFSGEVGEPFSIQVELDRFKFVENFTI